jgi:polyvinyl alcohol dehydrogenase (cytochrome)
MTHGRTTTERRAMAEFASGKSLGAPFSIAPTPAAMCSAAASSGPPTPGAARWSGFGQNLSNTRFQPAGAAGIAAADVPRLKLKWAFGLPGDVQSWAAITLQDGRLYVGSIAGNVYSLDARTGCVHWAYDAGTIVRTAVNLGRIGAGDAARDVAFFGDARGNMHAVDARTGQPLWKVSVESFPSARLTGSAVFVRQPAL